MNSRQDVKNNSVRIETVDKDGHIDSRGYNISTIPYFVISVQSSNKTSRDDLSISGTH